MDYRFDEAEWYRLTPAERAKRCRAMAYEASELARSADMQTKRLYLELAEQWEALAAEIERQAEQDRRGSEPR